MNLSNAAVKTQENWQAVCQADDLVADSGVVVWLDGAQVALFYLPGLEQSLYAVDNRDPRSGANIIGRGLVGSLQGELVVAAPLYKQHFSLQSGECLEDAGQRLRVWQVRMNGGAVELAVVGAGPGGVPAFSRASSVPPESISGIDSEIGATLGEGAEGGDAVSLPA